MTEKEESAGKRQERETDLSFTEIFITELLTGNKTEVGCAEIEKIFVCKKIIVISVDMSFCI